MGATMNVKNSIFTNYLKVIAIYVPFSYWYSIYLI